jgi:hypothetical protein
MPSKMRRSAAYYDKVKRELNPNIIPFRTTTRSELLAAIDRIVCFGFCDHPLCNTIAEDRTYGSMARLSPPMARRSPTRATHDRPIGSVPDGMNLPVPFAVRPIHAGVEYTTTITISEDWNGVRRVSDIDIQMSIPQNNTPRLGYRLIGVQEIKGTTRHLLTINRNGEYRVTATHHDDPEVTTMSNHPATDIPDQVWAELPPWTQARISQHGHDLSDE